MSGPVGEAVPASMPEGSPVLSAAQVALLIRPHRGDASVCRVVPPFGLDGGHPDVRGTHFEGRSGPAQPGTTAGPVDAVNRLAEQGSKMSHWGRTTNCRTCR